VMALTTTRESNRTAEAAQISQIKYRLSGCETQPEISQCTSSTAKPASRFFPL
jgi:hypothetical protein